jgi:caffeoyl-CoA O-methyltransferase
LDFENKVFAGEKQTNSHLLFPNSSTMKYISLNDEICRYVIAHRSAGKFAKVLQALQAETKDLGDIAEMQIAPEQGSFFSLLVAATKAQNAIEIGTFTGYSSLCIAAGLPASGKLLCLDSSEEWTQVARKYWKQAGLESRIELRIGEAGSTLAEIPETPHFDFAFVDADKTGYDNYYELLLPRLHANALIVFDNMLSNGRVAAENIESENARALDAMNKKLARDARVESVLLPLADGLNICRKL